MEPYVKKTYTCADCGLGFTLGRGRPPLVPLCPTHKAKVYAGAESSPSRTAREPLENRSAVISSIRNVEAAVAFPVRRSWGTKLVHPAFSIQPCPNCQFPEAEGGYCPDCGWSKPINLGRVS